MSYEENTYRNEESEEPVIESYEDLIEYERRLYRRNRYRNKSGVEEKRKKRFINSNWDDRHPIIKALYCLNYFL